MKSLSIGVTFVALVSAHSATAANAPPAMIDFATQQLEQWINVPEVVNAIKEQNARNADISQSEIDALDKKWRAEVGQSDSAMVNGIMNSALSAYLLKNANAAQGLITEVFVMDMHGLNVGQSALTSDYWQGDEAKFQATYPNGTGAVHASEIELDESTQAYQGQVSFPVTDADGTVIGAVTFGLNAETFF